MDVPTQEIKTNFSLNSLSASAQANKFEKKIEKWQKSCKTQDQIDDTIIEQITTFSVYMLKNYGKPDWRHFDILFIKYLRFLLDLQEIKKNIIDPKFPLLTEMFFSLCGQDKIQHSFINQLLDIWLRMTERVSKTIKYEIFSEDEERFEKCVDFLKSVGCCSMQQKMLSIMLGYVNINKDDDCVKVSKLFAHTSKNTYEIYKGVIGLREAGNEASIYGAKRSILLILNRPVNSLMISTIIQKMWFDGKNAVNLCPGHKAWLDFNVGSKTVEFCFLHNGLKTLAKIDEYSLKVFELTRSETEHIQNICIRLKNPLHLELLANGTASDTILLEKIQIQLTFGVSFEHLRNSLDDMFPNRYEIKAEQVIAIEMVDDTSVGISMEENNDTNLTENDPVIAPSMSALEDKTMEEELAIRPQQTSTPLKEPSTHWVKSSSRDSSTDEDECQSSQLIVEVQVHRDLNGNPPKVQPPKKNLKRLRHADPPNFDEITFSSFDEQYFDKKVAKFIPTELLTSSVSSSEKENKKPVDLAKPKENDKKNEIPKKPAPKKRGEGKSKITKDKKPKERTSKRPSRACAKRTIERFSSQTDVYDFLEPISPAPKRKSTKRSSAAVDPKPPIKRVLKNNNEIEPLKPKVRKLYTATNSDDELPPIEEEKPNHNVIEIEDDQLTSSSFEEIERDDKKQNLKRLMKNVERINQKQEFKEFDTLFSTTFFDRGQVNETATYSYRKFAKSKSVSNHGDSPNK